MGVIERKEREKEEMRRKILDAARHLFLEVGYEKTGIRGIAEIIEYSPATIYLLDLKIFIDAKEHIKLKRRISKTK